VTSQNSNQAFIFIFYIPRRVARTLDISVRVYEDNQQGSKCNPSGVLKYANWLSTPCGFRTAWAPMDHIIGARGGVRINLQPMETPGVPHDPTCRPDMSKEYSINK